jgi:adenine-specific DNA-methyltransferase
VKNLNLDENPVVEYDVLLENDIMKAARERAENIRDSQVWPVFHFGSNGYGRPTWKRYLEFVKQGKVPLTYWADEDYELPLELGSQSWDHEESGHSQTGIKELDAVVGKGHNFDTVKPLKLIMKIIQIWCPPNGLVLDPYAGSGTTGHAVLELNRQTGSDRRFVLIEQGNREDGDKYARTLTQERLRRVITGERPGKNGTVVLSAEPIEAGFIFHYLISQIDAKTVLSMRRDELIDVVISSHWEQGKRSSPSIIRVDASKYDYLVGRNEQEQGYFIIWNGEKNVGQVDRNTFKVISVEAKKAGLKPPFYVYARYEVLQSPNVIFYKIPDKILSHLGLNENTDRFNNGNAEARD